MPNDKEYSVEEVILDLLDAPVKFSEADILAAFKQQDITVDVMKFQRPTWPQNNPWLVYNQSHDIMQTFTPDMMDPLFIDMNERGSTKQYYWVHIEGDRIQALVNVPCEQEQSW